jgi:DNA topoisomerase-1
MMPAGLPALRCDTAVPAVEPHRAPRGFHPAMALRNRAAAPAVPAEIRAAGLTYSSEIEPGLRRRRAGPRFRYVGPNGRPLTDRRALDRVRALAIPPAWTDVWICPDADGHLQATGRDQRGRKQYRYHTRWREVRDEAKFGRMAAFGRALPAIRKRVTQELAEPRLGKEKVIALVVRLLETTLIRVGNEEYVATNGSYGLTTLRNRHVRVAGTRIVFAFRAKSGKDQRVDLADRRIARLVRACRDLPGQRLFQYIDEDGEPRAVTSTDVNAWLRETTGEDFTAKDFRTWTGSLLAAIMLSELPAPPSQAAAQRAIVGCLTEVAHALGNTVAVTRKCYVHPGLLEAFAQGRLLRALGRTSPLRADRADAAEACLLRFCARSRA